MTVAETALNDGAGVRLKIHLGRISDISVPRTLDSDLFDARPVNFATRLLRRDRNRGRICEVSGK
jgi:hypothetical protein